MANFYVYKANTVDDEGILLGQQPQMNLSSYNIANTSRNRHNNEITNEIA